MKVYGLPEDQGLVRRNDMAQTFIVPEANVSVAFSALKSCSVIMRWITMTACRINLHVEMNSDSCILLANDT